MDTKEFVGLELAHQSAAEWTGKFWLVSSETTAGAMYRVDADATKCTCEDFALTDRPCKHLLAVRHLRAANRGTPLPERPADPPKKPAYKQNWPLYNAAQTNEKRLFLDLLADLCRTVPEPAAKATGRPRIPLRDALFAAVFKVYSTVSGRRFTTDLKAAASAGHLTRAPHYNSIFRVLEDDATTPIFRHLVTLSSLPLKAVETTFAVDSSGFSTNRFGRWFDKKYGTDRTRAEWVKVHVCVGVKTNVVTAVEIGGDGDSVMFDPLVRATAANFALGDVTADKAYLSKDSVDLVEELGGTPFVPFKVNSVGDKQGEVWRRMFHYFHLRRADFLTHYHQRSNVESAFSMMKRKFGDSLRSKSPVALHNEALAKVLCHNVVVLIHEMHELGIVPTFGGDVPEDAEPRILRFPGA